MKNRGVTLIELMIVIAILGIVFNMKGLNTIVKDYKVQEKRIQEQEMILKFQKKFNKLLKESKSFVKVTNKQIVTDKLKLMTSNTNDKIFLNGKVYEFNNFKLLNFKRTDDIVKCDVINGNHSFYLYLVPGKADNFQPKVTEENSSELDEHYENESVEVELLSVDEPNSNESKEPTLKNEPEADNE